MKTIIKSVFLVAILALVVTGCQKEGDDLNVSLKSTIAFTGGIYISPWQSGNAEFECAQAGGCDGGSYKMDQGVYAGSSFNGGGVTVTGISKQEFSWSSIYPVCKIIVKAGNGAYIFDIGGAQSGSVPYPKDLGVKEKDISHITFCFGKPETPPEWVIALKTIITSTDIPWAYGVSGGTVLSTGGAEVGYNNYILGGADDVFPLMYGFGPFNQIGTITAKDYVENNIQYLELVIDTDVPDWSFMETYLYVGTLDGLKGYLALLPANGLYYMEYEKFPFFKNEILGQRIFKIPFSQITE